MTDCRSFYDGPFKTVSFQKPTFGSGAVNVSFAQHSGRCLNRYGFPKADRQLFPMFAIRGRWYRWEADIGSIILYALIGQHNKVSPL